MPTPLKQQAPPPRRYNAKPNARPGQNLVELVLVLPLFVAFLFFLLEFGRAWQVYEATKLATIDGAYTAAMTQNAQAGVQKIRTRLQNARIRQTSIAVTQVNNQKAFEASVQVVFEPMFSGITIPTLSGPIPIFPAQIPIRYSAVKASGVI